MKIKDTIVLVLGLLLLLFLIYFLYIRNLVNPVEFSKNDIEKLKIELITNFDLIDPTMIIYDLEGNKKNIGSTIHSDLLIFRFSFLDCESCVRDNLNKLDSIYKKGYKKILVIGYFNQIREILIDYKTNKYSVPFYILENNRLNCKSDDIKFPHYLVINENLRIIQTFIPGFYNEIDKIFLDSVMNFIL